MLLEDLTCCQKGMHAITCMMSGKSVKHSQIQQLTACIDRERLEPTEAVQPQPTGQNVVCQQDGFL